MAYKTYIKKQNDQIEEIPIFAEKSTKDGNGNVISSTYSTKTELNNLSSVVSTKADLNNSSQQINAGVVSAPTGNFTNIANDLSKKIEVVSYGDVTLTGKIAVSGWYIKKRIVLGGSVRYEFEITIPTFNISTFINQNSDTNVVISGLPEFNNLLYNPIVLAVQTSPGPTNDYMNSQSIQYASCDGANGTITLRARRAYSEAYTYVNIYVKGIMT